MLMEKNRRERSMADIMKGGGFSSPLGAQKEAQISPVTPLRSIARKRKLVFDDEPLLPTLQTQAAAQCLDSSIEAGSSQHNNGACLLGSDYNPLSVEETAAVNVNTPPRILPQRQHYLCASENSSGPDEIRGLNTSQDVNALVRNAQSLLNAVNRSGFGTPNANVGMPNARLGYANYNLLNPSSNFYANGWNRPVYPYFSTLLGFPTGIPAISALQYFQSTNSTPYQPQQQTFSSLQNTGGPLAPDTPDTNIKIKRLRKKQFVGRSSDGRVVAKENQHDSPEKSIQYVRLLETQSHVSSDERVAVQKMQQDTVSIDVQAPTVCGDESILPPLIDPSSFTLQTPTKNNERRLAAEGEKDNGGIDLNKTPLQKPKRKKHRPRVIREGPSVTRSKAKNKEHPRAKTNSPDYRSNPPVQETANLDEGTSQKLQTDVSVDQLAEGMAAGYQEPLNFFSQRQPAVLHQEDLLSSSLRPLEAVENSRKRGSTLSSPKRAFRENYKTLARRKEKIIYREQTYALILQPLPDQIIKPKGKKPQARKHNVGNETDTAAKDHRFLRKSGRGSHIDSSISGLYSRQSILDPVDTIIERLKRLQLNDKAEGNAELVPYVGNHDIVPYVGPFDPLKKRKHRPRVDLDAETNRVWRLLMGKASEEDKETPNNEASINLEKDREIFRGRVDSFIARMRLVQGDRRFSQWKGSVVDSVVGAFLTQNVSDHLSSSAFISLASRFPSVEKNEGTTCDSNDLGETFLEKEKLIEDVRYTVQFPDQVLQEQNPGHPSMAIEVDELFGENLKESANGGESSASNPLGDKGSSSQAMNSANGSESNSDVGEQTNESNWIHTDTHSFTELLREVENRTLRASMTFEKQHDLVAVTTDPSFIVSSIHNNYNSNPLGTPTPSSEILDHSETGSETAQDHMIDFLGRNSQENDHQCNVSSTQGSSLTEDSMHAAATLWSLAQQANSTLHPECLNLSEGKAIEISELPQSSMPPVSQLSEDFGIQVPKNLLEDGKSTAHKVSVSRISGIERANIEMNQGSNKHTFDWESVRNKMPKFFSGIEKERDPNTNDAMNWEAVRCADVEDIADTIKERGMNNILAGRIKAFLQRLHAEQGCIDLEWVKDIPPDDAKNFLLSVRGLGLKSVECIRLLTLQHMAFPVDTNVGRISVRLGWVPIMPLPDSMRLHLLELYPVQATIQKYLWPRLCMLDQRTLYELHYHMITFGKVFCTKSKPNCNACPMRGECKHFASALASSRLLEGPPEGSSSVHIPPSTTPTLPCPQQAMKIETPSGLAPLQLLESSHQEPNCEPIIEEPATPEPECIQSSDFVVNECAYTDPDEIPVIKLNLDELSYNIQQIYKSNMQDVDINSETISTISKAIIMLSPEDASIPAPKLKYVHRLRTEHQVYEIPDNHPLLREYEDRQPDDPSPYLLAIWTTGESSESTEEIEQCCSPQILENHPSNQESSTACISRSEINEHTVKGTILIPCRTAMRGNFPLNGTYFQVNEVFADHETSLNPLEVPRSWIWNLNRRTVLVGTSIPSIFKGLTTKEIQSCFWRGFVCVRAFDRNYRAPRPLVPRLHSPASKLIKPLNQQTRKRTVNPV